ncbi:MAG: hypothetical protein R2712_14300 [Vicinamibacterales bacterium]
MIVLLAPGSRQARSTAMPIGAVTLLSAVDRGRGMRTTCWSTPASPPG